MIREPLVVRISTKRRNKKERAALSVRHPPGSWDDSVRELTRFIGADNSKLSFPELKHFSETDDPKLSSLEIKHSVEVDDPKLSFPEGKGTGWYS